MFLYRASVDEMARYGDVDEEVDANDVDYPDPTPNAEEVLCAAAELIELRIEAVRHLAKVARARARRAASNC